MSVYIKKIREISDYAPPALRKTKTSEAPNYQAERNNKDTGRN
jgi:hypothetical protein